MENSPLKPLNDLQDKAQPVQNRKHKLSRNISLITLFIVFTSYCIYNFNNKDWNNERRIIQDDVQNYYVYIPAAVIYHDINLEKVHRQLPENIRQKLWLVRSKETGLLFSKMTMGLAIIQAPFIAITHYLIVPLTDYPADGYSPPYKITLLFCSLLFLFIGLWYMRKILLTHYHESIVAFLLLIVGLGTNLTWYVTTEPAMSHVYSFALIIVFYYRLQYWLKKPEILNTILLGFLFGLIVLIRPTNIIVGALFLASEKPLLRIKYIASHYQHLLLMIAAYMLIWAPQLAFWKFSTGHWFMYTYGDEGFFFNNPQVLSSLFSYRKGWLIYTPLMALTFIGLPFLWKKNREIFWQVSALLVLLTYVNASWWCWWFGGSFGLRAYIDGYGLFALAIGAFLQAIFNKGKIYIKLLGAVCIIGFIALNIFQTWQYRVGLIHYAYETKHTFWMNFLRTKPQKNYFESLVQPDIKSSKKGHYFSKNEVTESVRKQFLHKENMKRKIGINYLKDRIISNKYVLDEIKTEAERLQVPVDTLITKRATAEYDLYLSKKQ